jgi:hypothetical protein
MPLTKLQFRPGINTDITSYSNEGGWTDCDKIRFKLGYPEKIGGWSKLTGSTYLGTARRLHNWTALDGSDFLGVGTHLKYYIEEGGSFNDITPVRKSTTNSTTFAATNGSANITVTETSHGASENDFVTFSGATDLFSSGGAITAAILNAEHKIVNIIDGNSYTITVSVAANASDTGNGGGGTDAVYLVSGGLDSQVGGTGWGAGLFGGTTAGALTTQLNEALDASETEIDVDSSTDIIAGDTILIEEELITVGTISSNTLGTGGGASTRGVSGTTAATHADNTIVRLAVGNASSNDDFTGWGIAAVSGTTREIRTWSHDNFGEDLIINPRDGGIFLWDKTTGLSTRAVEIGTISGAENTPTVAKQVLVSDIDRHVLCFGTNTYGTDVQDPLMIRWSNQESVINWTISSATTAGSIRLGSGSEFVQAIETKREILVYTDTSLHSLRFIGGDFVFGIQQIASNITIMGPNAAVATEDFVFWMGKDNFYVYAGGTKTLPCTVKDKVFLDFNNEQRDKVVSGVNSEFGEVIWLYPSQSNSLANSGTGDIDKYVIYNYNQQIWYYGTLARTAWLDKGIRQFPIAAGTPFLYNHEFGFDDDGSAMTSFIESGPMDIGDGDKFTLIQKVIPDLTFQGSDSTSSPAATFTIRARNEPGLAYSNTSSGTATRTSTSPVELFTNQINLRARGRSFSLKVDSSATGMKWKLGSPRVSIRPDGRR